MPLDTPLPSAVRGTGTASSAPITVPQGAALRADLVVTASSGPTTLDVKLEQTNDGGTTWVSLGAFTQVGAVSSASQSIAIGAPTSGTIRATYTVAGTSYTFSVVVRSVDLA